MPAPKQRIEDLAVFGGRPCFDEPKSTSNLVRPDIEGFLDYSRIFYEKHRFTNDGPLVKMLEQRLAGLHETAYCVTFCSGFWALALSMLALARPGRDEVLMPSLTYRRMADIAAWNRLKPRFCEVDTETLAISPDSVRTNIGPNTALILGVHPIVNCCDVSALETLAEEHDIPLLFDSVESVFESIETGKIGRFGAAEVFSLHASKLLNGFEGGYVTTNDAELARKLALLRGFGFEGPDNIAVAGGMNAKLNEVHAAMALACLDDLDAQVQRNRARYECYKQELVALPELRLLEFDERWQTSYKTIIVELLDDWPLDRELTLRVLNAEKILSRAYYAPPLHSKETAYPCVRSPLPLTEDLSNRFMLMPCGHFITAEDIHRIVALLRFLRDQAPVILAATQQGAQQGAVNA